MKYPGLNYAWGFHILALIGIIMIALLVAILVFVKRGTRVMVLTGPRGARGCSRTGPTGSLGEIGPTGDVGPTGSTGEILITGATGGPGMVLLNSNTFNLSDGIMIGSGYIASAANEFMASLIMTNTFTLQSLYVNLTSIPGGGNARVFTVRVNGVNTSLSVTIAGFVTSGSNTVNTVPVVAGDRVSVQTTSIGTPMPSTCEASYAYA